MTEVDRAARKLELKGTGKEADNTDLSNFLKALDKAMKEMHSVVAKLKKGLGANDWEVKNKWVKRLELAFPEIWGKEEAKVVHGIVRAWKARPWDLQNHPQEAKVFPDNQDKLQRLADCLELRAVFAFAHSDLHPDSSEVYAIRDSDVQIPMI